ncbi:MAG: Smr/MutS family protein, partial [Treponema sp.]|nr:Smr/MutS family protein [Treponema sp.]
NRRQGTLVQKNNNGTWTVLFGSLKMDVDERMIEPVHKITTQQKPSVVVETLSGENGNDRPVFELRLLGMRQEEAVKALERQLDLCAIYNLRQFSIIHGKGQGLLQQSVQDYLSHYPGIKSFEFARPEDGGSGKTYVTLF